MMMTRQALAAVLVVLLPAAGLRADEPEERAIQVIKKLGGRFTRDDKAAAKPVVAVTLAGFEVTDATLKELKGLTSLETLQLILRGRNGDILNCGKENGTSTFSPRQHDENTFHPS